MSEVRERFARVLESVDASARRAGRNPAEVRVVAVTKRVDVERIREAVEAGATRLGENRVQEAEPKILALDARASAAGGVEWHLIGHLQSNKARRAVGLFQVIESVDSLELARRLDSIARQGESPLRVLFEIKTSGEAAKTGLPMESAEDVIAEALELPGLQVEGLMTMAPFVDDAARVRASFASLRELRDRAGGASRLPELSMGMSADFPLAIEEGATLVRIGTAIFG